MSDDSDWSALREEIDEAMHGWMCPDCRLPQALDAVMVPVRRALDALAAEVARQRGWRRDSDAAFDRYRRQVEILRAAIECVLLDHVDRLDGEEVDANLAELAHAYQQATGWDAKKEAARGR